MRVTKRLMAALLACLMLLSLLPVPAYAADDGRIALLAVTQDGYVIEPEYIGYRSGDTVKDVLKNSGHTFSGIDSGFITAVDGRPDGQLLPALRWRRLCPGRLGQGTDGHLVHHQCQPELRR